MKKFMKPAVLFSAAVLCMAFTSCPNPVVPKNETGVAVDEVNPENLSKLETTNKIKTKEDAEAALAVLKGELSDNVNTIIGLFPSEPTEFAIAGIVPELDEIPQAGESKSSLSKDLVSHIFGEDVANQVFDGVFDSEGNYTADFKVSNIDVIERISTFDKNEKIAKIGKDVNEFASFKIPTLSAKVFMAGDGNSMSTSTEWKEDLKVDVSKALNYAINYVMNPEDDDETYTEPYYIEVCLKDLMQSGAVSGNFNFKMLENGSIKFFIDGAWATSVGATFVSNDGSIGLKAVLNLNAFLKDDNTYANGDEITNAMLSKLKVNAELVIYDAYGNKVVLSSVEDGSVEDLMTIANYFYDIPGAE